jgi:hypothetical protein
MLALREHQNRCAWMSMRMTSADRWLSLLLTAVTIFVLSGFMGASPARATVSWSARAVADPTHFSHNDESQCEEQERCDRYQIVVRNVGSEGSTGPIEVTDKLPPGITTTGKAGAGQIVEGEGWVCGEPEVAKSVVSCTSEEAIGPEAYAPVLRIPVMAPAEAMSGQLRNEVTVTGGGATGPVSINDEAEISSQAPPFELTGFTLDAIGADGAPSTNAGAHPYDVTAAFDLSNVFQPPGEGAIESQVQPLENLKEIVVELPAGFIGNPQATPTLCPEHDLIKGTVGSEEQLTACPATSRVGVVAFDGEGFIRTTGAQGLGTTSIYNMVPQDGYPAEFAFVFANKPIYMYASLVHTPAGYRIRIASANVPAAVGIVDAALTFFGNPAALDNAGGPPDAFLTNPASCSESPLTAKVEADSWENPERWVSLQATTYPQLSECNLLQFAPTLEMAPSSPAENGTSQADEPSGYSFDLRIPQTSLFEERATPQLRDATVTLPEGVSVSPAAADGLAGCKAVGQEGINIGSTEVGHVGQDLGNPQATELGAGHAGGNGSLYDDGLYHTARGHCPLASTIGTVEILTPVLPAALHGHVYLAQPRCGGAGQPECTQAAAEDGELFSLYIEAEGSGVIVKLPGVVAANASTGRLTATFLEDPQLPFSELKLHLNGGARAPLANPQSCGTFNTTSSLTPWSSATPATPSAPAFMVDWDGRGGKCPAGLPFAPGFSAGVTAPVAGAFSPFVLAFSRQDREQDLSAISVTLPSGLLAKIAGIPLCGEAQANQGACGPASLIGTVSVLAGPGEHPLGVSGGRVYLTTGYKGQPFGLSIVVPAVAGPFNLGDVVVRGAIHIDPSTAQVTVTTDPLPASRDGVPFRLRMVNTEINRSGFMFTPTNCTQQQIVATLDGAQGATAGVSSPFAVADCAVLPFRPSFAASTQAKTSKADGASLVVQVGQKPGEANIHKVDLQLPLILPARLTTLQKACTEAQFATNPAGCPEASVIGTATAITPVLGVPLAGPAYLVSHGGAAFPDVEFILQGDGVTIVLDGKTDIKKGITYSRFETVPDAPISSFETTLPEGPHSALTANASLCGHSLLMPTTIIGQNGAQVEQTTKIAVLGCGKVRPSVEIRRVIVKHNAVLVMLASTQRATVTVSGRGLRATRKTIGIGTHEVKALLTKLGKSELEHRRKTKVKVGIKNANGSSGKTKIIKL